MAQQPPGLTNPPENDTAVQITQTLEEIKQPEQPTIPATQVSVPTKQVKQEPSTEQKMQILAKASESSRPIQPKFRPHAFVVMPFGKKKGADGSPYDFNAIYKELIKPALKAAGFQPFRADEETASGDILTDMFQELLLADLVLCDLSIDNANAFYELGIRHAFRKRGVMHIQAGRAYMPFDIFNVRTLPYHITTEGVPDPAFLRADITAIARMAKDTWGSDRDAVHSPIFNLLSGLKEPDRKTLTTPLATGFWREYNLWKERMAVAQRQKRIGDILLLTEEMQNPMIKEEAIGQAGKALASLDRYELALNQYRKGLEINSANITFRREEAFHLNRLRRADEAIIKIENLLKDFPKDSEAIAYLGRIYKEMWVASWREIKDKTRRMKAAFDSYHWLIKSIDTYLSAYRIDLNNYYPGINALTLSTIAIHLADLFDEKKDPNPDIKRIRAGLDELCGALTFALEAQIDNLHADYWTLISLAELRMLTSNNIASVNRAYRKALTAPGRDLSSLNSSVSQLKILQSLGMREECVLCGLDTLTEEILRVDKDEAHSSKSKSNKPSGRVFLFSGYMVDYDVKEHKTFPADKEKEIRAEIRQQLKELNANSNDLGYIAGLSAGSELLFAEICAEMGIYVRVYLPLPESAYIREFVSLGGDKWVDRFYQIRDHPLVDEHYQSERVGPPKPDDDPYERNNRWALYSSWVRGVDKVRLIALWNGRGGRMKDRDARLVQHMVALAHENGIAVDLINTSKYIHDFTTGAYDGLPSISNPPMQVVEEVKLIVKPRRKKK